jgi:hypothetical protein
MLLELKSGRLLHSAAARLPPKEIPIAKGRSHLFPHEKKCQTFRDRSLSKIVWTEENTMNRQIDSRLRDSAEVFYFQLRPEIFA